MIVLDSRTIAAIATPLGRGGIGIIKISGTSARSIADKLFRSREALTASGKPRPSANPSPETNNHDSHRLRYGFIIDPDTGRIIDEVLLAVMAAPHTYTGEDVVEINAHSGIFVLKQIYKLVLEAGAVPADHGEFTKRAFLNGRIDLVQAEAVMDLINARSFHAADLATRQLLHGRDDQNLNLIREKLLRLAAGIEAAIDFPDDVDHDFVCQENMDDIEKEILQPLKGMIRRFDAYRLYRDGLTVAIVGRPNVGKSSLLNRLLEDERAIVTDIPGTTRDLIDADMFIQGIPVVLCDTAGLRDARDEIEAKGIQKTKDRIVCAELVLFVLALDEGITPEDQKIYEEMDPNRVIAVFNKRDLVSAEQLKYIMAKWEGGRHKIAVSARYDSTLEGVTNLIAEQAMIENTGEAGKDFIPNLRQRALLEECLNSMVEYGALLAQCAPAEIMALEVQNALGAIDEIGGRSYKDDMIDQIFRRFCIGK